jgi:hypothetical protein
VEEDASLLDEELEGGDVAVKREGGREGGRVGARQM